MKIYVTGPVPGHAPEIPQTECTIPWCESLHIPNDDLGHFGDSGDFDVLRDSEGRGILTDAREEEFSIGLDQFVPGGEVMVCISDMRGQVWMSRDEALRLAMHLVKINLDAGEAL